MIGLDTNVLVRYIAQDDPVQSPIATNVVEQSLSVDVPGFISLVAMVETVWVLENTYGLRGVALAAVVERLLLASTVVVERDLAVFNAMIAVRKGRGSFADVLIAELGRLAGCHHTLTFDRKALRLPGFAHP